MATIEFCGTPFAAREKFLTRNAIEDMVAERLNSQVEAKSGISDRNWPRTIGRDTKEKFNNSYNRVLQIAQRISSGSKDKPELVYDGPFALLMMTEMLRRAGILNQEEAGLCSQAMLGHAKREDLIIVTLVRPRACLVREIVLPTISTEARQSLYIFFELFNQCARNVAANYLELREKITILEYPIDQFLRDKIFMDNANLAFEILGLPSIQEWSKTLETKPKEERLPIWGGTFGRTTAGLTEAELLKYLQFWDWSVDSLRRAQLIDSTTAVIGVVETMIAEQMLKRIQISPDQLRLPALGKSRGKYVGRLEGLR